MSLKRKIGIAAALMVLGGCAAGCWYYLWLTTPPAMPTTVEQAVAVIKSPRFKRLPESRRTGYLDKMQEIRNAMTPEQRRESWQRYRNDAELRQAMGEAARDMMYERAKDFAKASPEQRLLVLDGLIAMESFMRQRGGGAGSPAQPPSPRPAAGDRPSPPRDEGQDQTRRAEGMRRMQHQIEHGHPQKQALVGEFIKALMQRRRERGLPDEPPRRPSPGPPPQSAPQP